MRSTTRMPTDSSASTFSGLLVMRRTEGHVEQFQNLGGQFEFAAIGLEAQPEIGFDRIQSLILQFVGAQLGHQPYAAALLLLVEQNAGAGLGDGPQGQFQLQTAVAAQGAEDIPGKALGMNTNHGRPAVDIAQHQRDRAFDLLRLTAAVPGLQGSGSTRVPSKPRMRK